MLLHLLVTLSTGIFLAEKGGKGREISGINQTDSPVYFPFSVSEWWDR